MSSKADKNHLTLKQKAELCEMSMKPNFNKEGLCTVMYQEYILIIGINWLIMSIYYVFA